MNKGRLLTVKEFPRLFNFADACHNLHNTIKDICNIEAFQPVRPDINIRLPSNICMQIIAKIKELLAFMSLSTYSHDWFDTAREELKISRGLQSVGETRFGTIYWSLDSILRGIPAFISIVRNPKLGIESEVRDRGPVIVRRTHAI
jgi:hypothetical protein